MSAPSSLLKKHCAACEGKIEPLSQNRIKELLSQLDGWKYEQGSLQKEFTFENYYQTTAFVNATAWISHGENHHPDITFSYKKCLIRYQTHAVHGLSENDFICAAKVDALLDFDLTHKR